MEDHERLRRRCVSPHTPPDRPSIYLVELRVVEGEPEDVEVAGDTLRRGGLWDHDDFVVDVPGSPPARASPP